MISVLFTSGDCERFRDEREQRVHSVLVVFVLLTRQRINQEVFAHYTNEPESPVLSKAGMNGSSFWGAMGRRGNC